MAGQQRVAIIGAGLSGISAIKSCLEEGLEPVCFERDNSIGGIWYYTEEYREGQGARAYKGLSANDTKDIMCYSDFPFPVDVPPYLSCSDVYEYALSYCDKFGLSKYIHLNTKVLKLKKSRDYDVTGKWQVETEDSEKGVKCETFDFVMVCCGYYKKPRYPDIEGLNTFEGSIDHSMTFKDGLKYSDQRVLVVGNKHSAGDVACFVSDFADEVYISIGKGTWIIPKYGKRGVPTDLMILRRSNFWNLNKTNKAIMEICNSRFDHELYGVSPLEKPLDSSIMLNGDIQNKIMDGMIKVVGDLIRLGPKEAEFSDSAVLRNLDAIVFATGYGLSLDFMDLDYLGENGRLDMYKLSFPLKLPHHTLAVVGCLDTDGAVPPLLELQARLASRVFSGSHQLPSLAVMKEEVDRHNAMVFARYGRYKNVLPSMMPADEIAQELGIVPSWWDLIKAGPRMAYLYYYGPAFPYYYRLWGPHSWIGAREAIEYALEHGYYAKQLRKAPANIVTTKRPSFAPFVLGFLIVAALIKRDSFYSVVKYLKSKITRSIQ